MSTEPLPHSPAADRNKGPLLDVLQRLLPARAAVLEIASGTGQHAQHLAAAMPGWSWQPTEAEPLALAAIDARCAGLSNVLPPRLLDVLQPGWPEAAAGFDAVLCANLVHIAPWPVCAALMQGTARALRPGGVLLLYGPFLVDGVDTAPGNIAFDADLRARNPAWGLRRLEDVAATALAAGLVLEERVAMPANNLSLVFRPSR
jgi:SAM-dependent methyltransferase